MALFGIDVSSAQAGMDTGAIPADYVLVKVTGGVNYVNPFADAQLSKAKAAGKRTAIYHYVGDGNPGTAAQEAAWFLQNSAGYLDGTNVVVMDWEEGGNPNVTDSDYAQEFGDIVLNASGIQPVGYSDLAHIQYLIPAYNAGMPVWVAAYTLGFTPLYGYDLPQGPLGNLYGIAPVMWQFTSSGHLPGWNGNLDLNIFYSDGPAWDALAAKHGIVTQGVPTPAPQEDSLSQAEVVQLQLIINGAADRVIMDLRAHVDGIVEGTIKGLLAATVPNAAGGETSLGAMIGWNDVHVNATIAAVNKLTGGSVDPAVITKAVQDALTAGLKVTVSTGP